MACRARPEPTFTPTITRSAPTAEAAMNAPSSTRCGALDISSASLELANGSEGEPASSKDALLMSSAPHLVLDGAFIAASAVGADLVIVGVKVGSGRARQAIARALQE